MSGWAAAAKAGADLFGTVYGAHSANTIATEQMQAQERSQQRSEALQREFAQHGIRWRVEDAKAAGLHPLYAIGAAGASYTPTAYMPVENRAPEIIQRGISDMGQNIATALTPSETEEQRAERLMNMAVQASAIRENDARAAYYEAEAAVSAQRGLQSAPAPSGTRLGRVGDMSADVYPGYGATGAAVAKAVLDRVAPQASKVPSARSSDLSVQAGVKPMMEEHTVSPYGLKMRLPKSDEPMEAWGELSWYDKLALIAHNANYYGEGWASRFVKEFVLGKEPKYRHARPFTPLGAEGGYIGYERGATRKERR